MWRDISHKKSHRAESLHLPTALFHITAAEAPRDNQISLPLPYSLSPHLSIVMSQHISDLIIHIRGLTKICSVFQYSYQNQCCCNRDMSTFTLTINTSLSQWYCSMLEMIVSHQVYCPSITFSYLFFEQKYYIWWYWAGSEEASVSIRVIIHI